MHTSKQFRQDDVETIRSLVAANPLGTLVTNAHGDLVGNHIPFQWVDDQRNGTLEGHVARANPVWCDIDSNSEVLVVFSGVDAYISPSWYPSKAHEERVVPTGTTRRFTYMGICKLLTTLNGLRPMSLS